MALPVRHDPLDQPGGPARRSSASNRAKPVGNVTGVHADMRRPGCDRGGTGSMIAYDKEDQLQKIQAGLLQGETIVAVYDGIGVGTGFIGLTDRRIILQDNSFVGKRVALTSVPYNRVNAVSFVSDKSVFGRFASTSSISVSAGGKEYEIQFRGEEKARHAHDVILRNIAGFPDVG
jgi:hypothetical protein